MPKKPTPFEDTYPFITQWIKSYGWIEFGQDDNSRSLIRVLDEGGMVWEGTKKYLSLDEALSDLEAALTKTINELG